MKAVYSTWTNGGIQKSELLLSSVDGDEAISLFVESTKGTYMTLHAFDNEEEAILQYNQIEQTESLSNLLDLMKAKVGPGEYCKVNVSIDSYGDKEFSIYPIKEAYVYANSYKEALNIIKGIENPKVIL